MRQYRKVYVSNKGAGGGVLPIQYGSGSMTPLYFAGVPEQYGAGLGNILGSLFRRVVPFLFPAVKNVAKSFISSAARNLAEGKSFGESVKDTLKDTGRQALGEVGEIATKVMSGSGKRKKKRSKLSEQSGSGSNKRKTLKKKRGPTVYKKGAKMHSLQSIF